jgi:hypothetical protein
MTLYGARICAEGGSADRGLDETTEPRGKRLPSMSQSTGRKRRTNTHATTAAAIQARPLHTERVGFLAVQERIEPLFLTYRFDFDRRDEVDQPQHGIGEAECPGTANDRCSQLLS